MKFRKTAADPFSALFRRSSKRVCFIPIITFIYLFLRTIDNYNRVNSRDPVLEGTRFIKDKYFGFFWNGLFDIDGVVAVLLVLCGVIAGIVLFSFTQSKKQCNVVFSLGLSRKKIFLANYLAGIIPFYAAVIIAAFFELLAVFCSGYAPTAALIKMAVYFVVCFLGIYTLAFTVTSASIAYSGNIVEGLIFTAIIAVFPMVAGAMFGTMRGFYTLGGINVYEGKWNFFNPYLYMFGYTDSAKYIIPDVYEDTMDETFIGSFQQYFTFNRDGTPFYNLTIFDFSGAIMDFVYAAVIFVIAYLAFSKRRNEISGSFGRARGLNEICAVMAGLYVAEFGMYSIVDSSFDITKGSFLTFLYSVGFFIVPYFVFKMVFGYKRRLILKSMLKRVPACIAAIAIITVIFSTGLFGYSSRVPDAEDVASIEFSTAIANPYSEVNDSNAVHRTPKYGYVDMRSYRGTSSSGGKDIIMSGYGSQKSTYPSYTVEDKEQIEKIIAIHKNFVEDGRIKDNASDACALNFEIKYTLKNGKTVKRYYADTTEENAKQIMGLGDTEVVKSLVSTYFDGEDGMVGGYDLSSVSLDENPANIFFLYSKHLKKAHRCEIVTNELKKAIIADLENQSANDIFFHKPEDELGVISFGFSNATSGVEYYGYYMNEDGDLINERTGEISDELAVVLKKIEENSKKDDLTVTAMNDTPKSFVVTKSMTNTIKYLTEKGYIKYFESNITANDVKSMKLAKKSELRNRKNTDVLPLFTAGYSNYENIAWADREAELYMETDSHLFAAYVNNEITNKSTIQKVLDNCLLYGFCGNDYRIAEITFNDGTIATYCITDEVYEKLMK